MLSDPFVMGSCGKSMTATVVARVVARGALRFETTCSHVRCQVLGRVYTARLLRDGMLA